MIPAISNSRRQEIKNAVYHTIQQYGSPYLPLKIGSIIRKFVNIKLITYSSQIKKYGITYAELIIDAETKDSYAVYCKSANKYCIYYNDIDKNITQSNRVRWNLAHELGHIVLKHHEICSKEKLFRNNISEENYQYIEEEADYFAQLILVPHAALLGLGIRNSNHIRILCHISDPASKIRFKDYIVWKSNVDANDEYDKRIFTYYFNFIFKRKCTKCSAGIVQRYGKHCPICGSKNTLEWGDGDMKKYPLLETYDTGKLKECPTCHNGETEIEGDFCQICGLNLTNRCSNSSCKNDRLLPSNARHCPMCGEQTSFFNNNILKAWDFNPAEIGTFTTIGEVFGNEIDEELPFN